MTTAATTSASPPTRRALCVQPALVRPLLSSQIVPGSSAIAEASIPTGEGSGRTRNHTEYLIADLDFTADFTVRWIDMGAGYDPAVTVEKAEGFIERGDYTHEAFWKRCREVSQLRQLVRLRALSLKAASSHHTDDVYDCSQDGDAIIAWQQQRVVKQVETRQARRAQRRKACVLSSCLPLPWCR